MKMRLESGEDCEGLAFDGKLFRFAVSRAFAPGAPLRLRVELADGSRTLEGRSLGSKLREDQRYEVRMRFVNLRREVREALVLGLGEA